MKHPSNAEHRDTGQPTEFRVSMICFYREHNGDYLAIDTSTNRYYLEVLGKDHFEGRATAIVGLVGSVCTTGISRDYLQAKCKRIAKPKVPRQWRRAIGI
jgi:hypothetical protein